MHECEAPQPPERGERTSRLATSRPSSHPLRTLPESAPTRANERTASSTDAEFDSIVERARAGDGLAFARVVRRFDPDLRALAFRLLGDRGRMDDALQEAYVRAFRALPRFRGEASLSSWLYRIVYNSCLDELRRAHRATEITLAELEGAADVADLGETVSTRRLVAGALMALPLEQRAALLLVDGHGLAYDEAALVLGVARGTIASRLGRARPALRRLLEEEEGGAP